MRLKDTLLLLAAAVGLSAVATYAARAAPIAYTWDSVAIGGGGFVSAIIPSRSEPGVVYARTDVGGAYRWDKPAGNGMGRQNGERLVVDPGSGNVLYVGTRWNGLFNSVDSGASWKRMPGMPVTTTPNQAGISFVVADPSSVSGGVAQRLYVGVSRFGATGPNFYRSNNAGATFAAVPNAPAGLIPQRAALDNAGNLYVTYANGAGPHEHTSLPEPMDRGQIWKYNIGTGAWANVTPAGFTTPFSGISVDPKNPQRLIASTINTYVQQGGARGDRIVMSTNGGATWTDIVARGFARNNGGVSWIHGKAIHWAGSIEFDPSNTKSVWVTSGNGVFKADNVDLAPTTWTFTVKGLEETVPLNIASIPDGPLVSVIGDYDAKGQLALSADGATLLHSPENSTTSYRSINNGSSWIAIRGLNAANTRPVADAVNANKFYVYDDGAVMVSIDAGASFSVAGKVAGGGSVLLRAAPDREGDIWIALKGGGLVRSINSGTSFVKQPKVTYAGALGFGKAAVGASYPAIYLWGTVRGVRGVHRSLDSGANWSRVNDDAHQYGGPGNGQFVIGDMTTFGTVYMSTAGRGIVFGKPVKQ